MARTPIRLSAPNIVDALRDPHGFGGLACFRDLASWGRWLVFLKAVYGLPMDTDELEIFQHHTGRTAPLPGGYPVAVVIVGRQSGKTRIAGTVAAYEALIAPRVPDGESEFALLVSQDERGALRTLFSYAKAPFTRPLLKAAVVGKAKKDSFRLSNGLWIACYPCRPEALRGPRARVSVVDELGFFITSDGHPTDQEMLRAVRYTLQNTKGRLLILSSPAGQYGALWKLHQDWWANEKAQTLIWKGTSPEMNPTIDPEVLARQQREDPDGYRSEVLAEFRSGLSALLDGDLLDRAVPDGIREFAPALSYTYVGFFDPSGGRGDAMTLGIAHWHAADPLLFQLDCVRGWSGQNPSGIAAEAADLYHRYGIDVVYGDSYGAELIAEHFRTHGIAYEKAPEKTRLYLELNTLVNSRAVGLLDHPTLLRELRGLERKPGTSGRDKVDHRHGAHDDYANAAAGALVMAALLAAQPDTPPNQWTREEYADVRRAFPGLELIAWSETQQGLLDNIVVDHEAGFEHPDMRWRRWDGHRWNYLW